MFQIYIDNMEADKSQRPKRAAKTPIRFQPWQEGDAHTPMAMRSQKSKLKNDQKKFREMKKEKDDTAKATAKDKDGVDAVKQAKSKKKEEKVPGSNRKRGGNVDKK